MIYWTLRCRSYDRKGGGRASKGHAPSYRQEGAEDGTRTAQGGESSHVPVVRQVTELRSVSGTPRTLGVTVTKSLEMCRQEVDAEGLVSPVK